MTVTMLTFLAQLMIVPCFRHIRKGVAKTLLEDAYHTICFVGDVNVWRGVWNLLNIYLVPGEEGKGEWRGVKEGGKESGSGKRRERKERMEKGRERKERRKKRDR